MRILVVGAGFSGCTVARELADHGHRVTVIEKRGHIAGNAFDYIGDAGIRLHKYGPHLFHTSNQRVVDWVTRFAEWTPYRHKVKALLPDGRFATLPVNAETARMVGPENIVNVLFRPYSRKMWGMGLEDLDSSVLARIPIRSDLNEYYFPDDAFQALPTQGYTHLLGEMLRHEMIAVSLDTPYAPGMERQFDYCFNSMPIDEFFEYRHGPLPYRSIRFHTFTLPVPRLFPVAVVNFTHTAPFTRVTEWKNLPGHGDPAAFTTITVEEPCDYRENFMERYYPVKDAGEENRARYRKYERDTPEKMSFIGRCGLYAYLNMDQAISSALARVRDFLRATA